MPIVYDKTKNGFSLKDPTEEELMALEKIAIDYITASFGKMAAVSFIRHLEQNGTAEDIIKEGTEKKIVYN